MAEKMFDDRRKVRSLGGTVEIQNEGLKDRLERMPWRGSGRNTAARLQMMIIKVQMPHV